MKAVKWIVITLAGLALLLVLAVALIALTVDPNRFKPQIEQFAARQGIDLNIAGDLEWRFFPSVAIGVGSTRAAGPDIPEITFEQAFLQVAWGPLLQREIAVKGIEVDGLHIDLGADATGEEALAAGGGAPLAMATEQELGEGTRLAIDSIRLTNSQIGYRGRTGAQEFIRDIEFRAENFNTDGRAFSVQAALTLPEDMAGTPARVEMQTRLRADRDLARVVLEQTRFSATSLDPDEPLLRDLQASFSADIDRVNDRAVLSDLELALQDLRISGYLEAEQITSAPRATGHLSIGDFDPRPLLAALDIELEDLPDSALRRIAFATDFSASTERVSLRDLSLRLDDLDIRGGLDAGLEPRSLDLTLTGNSIDLRRYMTPTGEAPAAGAPEQALLAPVAGALLWLEGGRGNISINFDQIITEEVTLTAPRMRLGASDHVLAINQISAGAWDGQLNLGGNVDFNHPEPAVRLHLEVTGIDVEQALVQLGEFEDLRGRLSLQFTGTSSGETAEVLQRNLIGEGSFLLTEPYFRAFNIERAYCELASLVEQRALSARVWDDGTQFVDLEGDFHIAGPRIVLNRYQSGVGNLAVSGRGRVNLEEENYEVLVNANLQAEITSEQGCEVRSTRIRNRDIPIQCRGSFDAGASCRPDEQFVQQLLRGQLEGLLRGRLEGLLDRNGGDGEEAPSDGERDNGEAEQPRDEDAVRSLLRGVLGR